MRNRELSWAGILLSAVLALGVCGMPGAASAQPLVHINDYAIDVKERQPEASAPQDGEAGGGGPASGSSSSTVPFTTRTNSGSSISAAGWETTCPTSLSS